MLPGHLAVPVDAVSGIMPQVANSDLKVPATAVVDLAGFIAAGHFRLRAQVDHGGDALLCQHRPG